METKTLIFIMAFSLVSVYLVFWNRKRIISMAKIKLNKNTNTSTKKKSELKINKVSPVEKEINYQVEKLSKLDIKNLLKKAEILVEHSEIDEAKKILVSIIANDAYNLAALLMLGSIYLKLRKYAKAEVIYLEINGLKKSRDPAVLSNLAFCLFEQNKIEQAKYYYSIAYELDSKNPKRMTNLGQVLFVLNEFQDAIDLFKKAHKFIPRDTDVIFMLADTLKASGNFKEALEYYKKIINLKPYNSDAQEEINKIQELGY